MEMLAKHRHKYGDIESETDNIDHSFRPLDLLSTNGTRPTL